MRQAIHILRKDVRHCWPYIAAVVALTAANAWQGAVNIPDPGKVPPGPYTINITLVLAWWLAIGAAIHGESLAGDRQFWVTRPYSWRSLLGAKLLFVVAFLGLPLFISDCIILRASGYSPLDLIPGLLWRQCWFLAFLVLPLVAAALTRRTGELVLVLILSWVISLGVLYGFMSYYGRAHPAAHGTGPSWIWDGVPWLAVAAGILLVVWQCARRRTAVIGALAVFIFGLMAVWTEWRTAVLMRGFDPIPREDWTSSNQRYRSVAIALASDHGGASLVEVDRDRKGFIGMPVKLGGWPRTRMSCRVSFVSIMLAKPEEYGRWGVSVSEPNSFLTTTAGGREVLWVSVDDLAHRAQPWAKTAPVDVRVSIDLMLWGREERVVLEPGRRWTHVAGFGNVRLVEHAEERHIVWRTALGPSDPVWYYSFANARAESVTDESSGLSVRQPASPDSFLPCPVYSYASAALPAGPPPFVFTGKRLAAKVSRELTLRQIRLADDASDNR
jgi:hypothetical protein